MDSPASLSPQELAGHFPMQQAKFSVEQISSRQTLLLMQFTHLEKGVGVCASLR